MNYCMDPGASNYRAYGSCTYPAPNPPTKKTAKGGTSIDQSTTPLYYPLNPRIQSPFPFTIYDNGYYYAPFGVRISTNPSLTIQTGSPLTVGPNGILLTGQNGNLLTRLTVDSEHVSGFGIASVDSAAGDFTESTGVTIVPETLSVTYTQSITIGNLTTTIPVQYDLRYNPHGVLLTGVVVAAILYPASFAAAVFGGITAGSQALSGASY